MHILKHVGVDNFIVAKFDNNTLEYNEDLICRIIEEIFDLDVYKKDGNKKVKATTCEKILEKLYFPYFVSEEEKPEFEIYKNKRSFA